MKVDQGPFFPSRCQKASSRNPVVRRHLEALKTWAALRNAIVHSTVRRKVITEPHIEEVRDIELRLGKMIDPQEIYPSFQVHDLPVGAPNRDPK